MTPLRSILSVALLLALAAVAGAQEIVVDQTGSLTPDHVKLLNAAQQALRKECGVTIAVAFFPQIEKADAAKRRSAIIDQLKNEGKLSGGAFALFGFTGPTSFSYTETREFGERVSSDLIHTAWTSTPDGLDLPSQVAAFLDALRQALGPGTAPTPGGEDVATPPLTPPTNTSFATTPLAQQELRPSNQPHTVSHGQQVSVTVPGGVVTAPTVLSIGQVGALPPEARGGFASIGAYEVSLGDMHEFDQDILVSVPYDPGQLEPGQSAQDQILALRWDEKLGCWTEVPCSFDEAGRRIIAHTRHLSILNFIYRIEVVLYNCLWENFTHSCIRVRNFRFYFDVGSLKSSKTVAGWRCEKAPDAGYEYLYKYSNPCWIAFMKDISYYLERSYAAYTKAGLDPLGKIPVVVKIAPDAAGTDPACYEHGTKRLYVSSNRVSSRDDLKHKLAHELFHAFQSSALGYDAALATSDEAKWWMESSAEYASCRLPWQLDLMGGSVHSIYPYLLEYKIPYTGNPSDSHKVTGFNELEYDKGYFLDHLVRSGAQFGPMFKMVSRALLTKRDGGPSGAGGPSLSAVREHVTLTTRTPFAEVYRRFAGWFLLSADAPLARSTTPDPAECLDNPGRALVVFPPLKPDPDGGAGQYYKIAHTMDLPGGHSARVFAVKPELPAGSTGTRPMVVKAPALPPEASLDVYLAPAGERVAGQPTPVASIGADRRGLLVEVPPGNVLYVVVANTTPETDTQVAFEVSDYVISLSVEVNGQGVTTP